MWVSPYINHFVSADTIVASYANPQGLDRYSYVTNNPLRYTDPTGHRMCEDFGGSCVSENQMTQIQRIHQRRTRHYSDNKQKDDNATQTPTLSSSNNPFIGEPQNLGNYLSGISMGGGQPNSFYVGGMHVENEGDTYYTTATGAGLNYGATYGVEFYQHGAVIHLNESYSLSANTVYTEINSAGSVLNVRTNDGIAHQVGLGEFEARDNQKRSTAITVYGSYPSQMNVTVFINLSDTVVRSAPLPSFNFFTQPSAVFP